MENTWRKREREGMELRIAGFGLAAKFGKKWERKRKGLR
jgi:hypothetical protein